MKRKSQLRLSSKNLAAATPAAAASTTTTATAAAATATAATSTTTAATAGNWGSEKKQLETQISDTKKQKETILFSPNTTFFQAPTFQLKKRVLNATVLYFKFQMTRIFFCLSKM